MTTGSVFGVVHGTLMVEATSYQRVAINGDTDVANTPVDMATLVDNVAAHRLVTLTTTIIGDGHGWSA